MIAEATSLIVCVSVVIFAVSQRSTAVCAVTSGASWHTLQVMLSAGTRRWWAFCRAWASDNIQHIIWCNQWRSKAL